MRNLVNLESLQIDRVPVDDDAASVIGKLANLTILRLHDSVITDEGMESISNLKQLRQLYIGGHFTDRGIQSLEKLQSLQFVSLSSPYADEQSGDVLAAAIPALQSVRVVNRSSNPFVRRSDMLGNLPPGMRLKGWINVPEGGVSIDDHLGRVVLVHFWGSWNERSVKSVPQLKRLHDQYHGKGLTILGVHTTAASENMEQFVRDHAIRWAVAHDVDNVTRRSWKTDSFPSNFLVDRNGLIRHADVRAEDLDRHVATLLDNEE
jgi:thiol-disulfide isomerase/thioredoxin